MNPQNQLWSEQNFLRYFLNLSIHIVTEQYLTCNLLVTAHHFYEFINDTVLVNDRRFDSVIFVLFTVTAAVFVLGAKVLGSGSNLIW